MKNCLKCVVVLPFLVACAETAITADNEPKTEKVYRTGSNLPARDRSSTGVITPDKNAAEQAMGNIPPSAPKTGG